MRDFIYGSAVVVETVSIGNNTGKSINIYLEILFVILRRPA
jgi:hypothetical protein